MERAGFEPTTERTLFVHGISSVDDWPDTIDLASPNFVLFLALDASDVSNEQVDRLAQKLLAQGLVFLAAWGRDAERVHDVFDEAAVARDVLGGSMTRDDQFLMTIWDEDQTLDEALWEALYVTKPADAYHQTCRSVVAAVVANPEWVDQVREAFADPSILDA